jgi:transcriptional antiterminator RfaH
MNNFPSGLRWYVIRTKPRSEELAQSYLSYHGITTFLPWMQTLTGRSGKDLNPLFPGYLFARFDVQEHYPLVKWGKGVNTILGYGRYPTPLTDDVISIIKSRTDDKNIVKIAYQLSRNDCVRIRSGPLKDLLGIFDRWVSDSGRVRVLLNLIGYQPKVELHYSQLEKLCA